jgi:uncharacterized Ntn-hydrolase superfamily protein
VVAIGIGVGATQAAAPPGSYRELMFDELKKGTPPDVIIELMQDILSYGDESRQFGIADHFGRAATFTGKNCAPWAGGRAGRIGDISYSVQGNIMVDEPVIAEAERAIYTTEGDLANKLMAAMEAARAQGGDKRCYNHSGKSSTNGFMLVGRIGDIDADCQSGDDCSNGTYFLDIDIKDQGGADEDPVLQMERKFRDWRASWIGRPDHLQSSAGIQPQLTPADGQTVAKLLVALLDWQGKSVGHGGASVIVTHDPASAGSSLIGSVTDNGDGTYTVPLTAGTVQGEDIFRVVVDDGVSPVRLYPNPSFTLGHPLRLRSNITDVSASQGDDIVLKLRASAPFAGRDYLILLSASGTDPGFDVGNVHIPLNLDAFTEIAYVYRNRPPLVNTEGKLDDVSRAEAQLTPNPGDLDLLIGKTLSFAYFTRNPDDFASEFVQVRVLP